MLTLRRSPAGIAAVAASLGWFAKSCAYAADADPTPPARLAGVRVLYTTPAGYASRLEGELRKAGATPIWCPTITTNPLHERSELARVLSRAQNYEAILFTSRRGIEECFGAIDSGLESPPHLPLLYALGADAQLIRDRAACEHLVRVPKVASTVGLVDELAREIAAGNLQVGASVLVPAPRVVGIKEPPVVPEFCRALTEDLKLVVHRVDAYVTAPAEQPRELDMLRNGQVDVVALTSVGEAEALLLLLGGLEAAHELLQGHGEDKSSGAILACFGPVTAAGLRELGLEPGTYSRVHARFADFVDTIVQYLSR